MRIALGIPHLPGFDPRRDEVVNGLVALAQSDPNVTVRVFDERIPNRAWAHKMWTWGTLTDCDFFLTLQDDVEHMPSGFWGTLRAMLTALPRPGGVLGLASNRTTATLSTSGRWCTEGSVVGWAYGLWKEDLGALVDHDLHDNVRQFSEDTLLDQFCTATGRRRFNPIPTIVDHQSKWRSTYGNDKDIYRRCVKRWDGISLSELQSPSYWAIPELDWKFIVPAPQARVAQREAKKVVPHKFRRKPPPLPARVHKLIKARP